ncbi:hypothetical protein JCGZ_15535 [Jatropha curcas]|uniref:Uncharacterized protein n=1 Tax=Jatropha curcas TaxID=180498 RepID=A0A067KG02_JATCU|nr:hypothetical protein JCGZ_15535 [Jatropha curcas]
MMTEIFIEATGQRHYRRIYGIRTQTSSYYSGTSRCATSASSPAMEIAPPSDSTSLSAPTMIVGPDGRSDSTSPSAPTIIVGPDGRFDASTINRFHVDRTTDGAEDDQHEDLD